MDHQFLFAEGIWAGTGKFYGFRNNVFMAEVKTEIVHQQDLWLMESFVKLLLDKPVEFQNRYQIKPFQRDYADWYSFNPDRGGNVNGKFMIVEDTIISTYASEDGVFSGVECMTKKGDSAYAIKGFAYKSGEKQSSWSMELAKVK